MDLSAYTPRCSLDQRKIFISIYFIAGAIYPVIGGVLMNNFYEFSEGLSLEFRRPWFLAWGMFIGCTLLLVPLYISKRKSKSPLLNLELLRDTAVPSICLMFGSVLASYGLIYLPAPIWQCIRSFCVIFTVVINDSKRAGSSILIEWSSMLVIVLGVLVSGMAVMSRQNYLLLTGSSAFFATLCIIAAEGIYAGGARLYDPIFKKWEEATPLEIVTYQGVWGLFLSSLIVLPLLSISVPSAGILLYENSLESFRHLFSSGPLFWTFIGFVASYVAYTLAAIETTDRDGTVRVQMYSSFLPLVLWPIGVTSHYISDIATVGEPIDLNTIPELIGFGIIILGTLMFIRVIEVPFFTYETADDEQEMSDLGREE